MFKYAVCVINNCTEKDMQMTKSSRISLQSLFYYKSNTVQEQLCNPFNHKAHCFMKFGSGHGMQLFRNIDSVDPGCEVKSLC